MAASTPDHEGPTTTETLANPSSFDRPRGRRNHIDYKTMLALGKPIALLDVRDVDEWIATALPMARIFPRRGRIPRGLADGTA
jgi:hypothetical protein